MAVSFLMFRILRAKEKQGTFVVDDDLDIATLHNRIKIGVIYHKPK